MSEIKARCPDCMASNRFGCDRCIEGYIHVKIPDNPTWTIVCMNQKECGFINGAYFNDTFPSYSSGPCVNCNGTTKWELIAEASSSNAYLKPKYRAKWEIDRLNRNVNALRNLLAHTKDFARAILPMSHNLTVHEAQLLGLCRICHKPASSPLILNHGQEYAHEGCLKE